LLAYNAGDIGANLMEQSITRCIMTKYYERKGGVISLSQRYVFIAIFKTQQKKAQNFGSNGLHFIYLYRLYVYMCIYIYERYI
jgi:hypothetical protein